MRKILCFLIFLALMPISSFAEIDGTLDAFKSSGFFTKYNLSQSPEPPYSVNRRTCFIDFYQNETSDSIVLEFDIKSQKIITQIGDFKEHKKIEQIIVDFIAEATSGTLKKADLADIWVKFEQKYSDPPFTIQNLGRKKIGKYVVEIERTQRSNISNTLVYMVKIKTTER